MPNYIFLNLKYLEMRKRYLKIPSRCSKWGYVRIGKKFRNPTESQANNNKVY